MPCRILIVDDQVEFARLLGMTLRRNSDYEVRTAYDGRQALEILSREPFEAVVLDVMLPGMDGLAICRHIRQTPRTAHLPVLMLSGYASLEDRRAGFEAGANDYAPKPIPLDEFVSRIDKLVCCAQARPAVCSFC